MQCTRLKHFRRVNANGTIGLCGHMIMGPMFDSIKETDEWSQRLVNQFANNEWPAECLRCQESENAGNNSIRQFSNKKHNDLITKHPEYLIIGGVLDSYCNSACLTCNSSLSSRIAKLNNDAVLTDNYEVFKSLPQDRIIQLDINGGEPSYSKNYQRILNDPPKNLSYLRINTNGNRVMPNLIKTLDIGTRVNVTLSLDGIDDVHDYIRWPVKFTNYNTTVNQYLELRKQYSNLTLDFWTTVSCLNINNLQKIIKYTKQKEIDHSYALLHSPSCLSVKATNWITKQYSGDEQNVAIGENNDQILDDYLTMQESMRGMARLPEFIR